MKNTILAFQSTEVISFNIYDAGCHDIEDILGNVFEFEAEELPEDISRELEKGGFQYVHFEWARNVKANLVKAKDDFPF